MIRAHRDQVHLLGLEGGTHHRPHPHGNDVEGEGLHRHLGPLHQGPRHHLVYAKPATHQREHPSAVERGEDDPRSQPTVAQRPQCVEERIQPRLIIPPNAVHPVERALRDDSSGEAWQQIVIIP